MSKPRVRFAPSPTGHLHIGGARTALFNWLFARHDGGMFILRIEDTDTTRSTDEHIEAIIEGMKWLGLDWDEGPFRQTNRFDIYRKYVEKLIAEGKAYPCYCSAEELEERRKEAMAAGRPVKYDRRCLGLKTPPEGIAPSIRFKMPDAGTVIVRDMIKGAVEFDNSQLDDLIIMRSDGTPTYNLVVVVDDVDMGITHVIRGDDHLNNTPKQLHIYKALGYEIPIFAHLPMILGADKARLSKRHGATSVMAYKDMGYLPDALVNYLVRLGWSHGDQEVFSRNELIELFSFESVGKSAAVFNPEKLLWLNAEYIKSAETGWLVEDVLPFLIKDGTVAEDWQPDAEWLARAIDTLRERSHTLIELAASLRYYIAEDVEYDEKAATKFLKEEALPYLEDLKSSIDDMGDFSVEGLEAVFNKIVEKHGIKLKNIAQPVRVAMTGGTASPGIFELLELIGRDKVSRRLEKAINTIRGD